jgi:DNA-directed RNA polymerase subunit RPC12/RpoP
MSILSRLSGGLAKVASLPAGKTPPYVAAPRGHIEVYGSKHHLDALRAWLRPGANPATKEAQVELTREPGNRHDPNAVAIMKDRALIGYMPKEYAAAWSQFIDAKNRLGQRVVATARAWARWGAGEREPLIYLSLEVPHDPAEYAAVEAAAAWRAAGLCIECGAAVERTGRRGSAIRCPDHTAKRKARIAADKASWEMVRVATHRCVECDDEYTDEAVALLGPLYECRRCDTTFARYASDSRSNRCPDCNRPTVRIADLGCPGCSEGKVVRIKS